MVVLTRTILTQNWSDEVYAVWSALSNATISIFTPGTKTYDKDTGTYTPGTDTVHYSGTARVQALTTTQQAAIPGLERDTQVYRFQLPRNSLEILNSYQVSVEDGGLNDYLESMTFFVLSGFNSSSDFEQTFLASMNAS